MLSNRAPSLSVILPAFNAEKFIAEAIDSILRQSFSDFELIIADDGSTDKTREIIDSYNDQRIVKCHNDTNIGKDRTVNGLFLDCKGEFVTIHDADDISVTIRFETQIRFLEQNPDYNLYGCSFVTITEKGFDFSKNEMPEYANLDVPLKSNLHGPTVIFRRSALLKLDTIYRKYFNSNFEDVDLCLRVLTNGGKGGNSQAFLYKYRIVPDSLCRKEITVRNRHLGKVAFHLAEQRLKVGSDDLMNNREDKVDEYLKKVVINYSKDPSRIHREAAAYYMYWKLHQQAMLQSWNAIQSNPLKIINYRILFYCLRKSFS